MTNNPSHQSRSALARARFFVDRASTMSTDERDDFEAFLEASIVFTRTAVHRFQTKYKRRKWFKKWWDSLEDEPSILFIQNERNFILKEGPTRVSQKIFAPFIGPEGASAPAFRPEKAAEFYYFDDPQVTAIDTVRQHINAVERILTDAERQFGTTP